MKTKPWKIIGTMLLTMVMGAAPGAGLFFLLNYLHPPLTHTQLFACLCFNFAVFLLGMLLGCIFGVGCLIFDKLKLQT